MQKQIYFDHAATTPVDERVFDKMKPYFTEVYGNANSQHYFGREAVKAVDEARDLIAKSIGAKPSELYFTSGGTESDNWALKGIAGAYKARGKHIIISPIEHAAMISTAKVLERDGFEISYMQVNEDGVVDLEHLKSIVRDDIQTSTGYGDIVLYSGNQIVIFYGSNSWAYTRLGHVDLSQKEMRNLLSNGDVDITLK